MPRTSATASRRGSAGDRESVERAVRRLQGGADAEASSEFLFRRFSPAVERQLIRWGADPAEAADLNQETFQRIFRDVGSFQGGGDRLYETWIGWVWKIARTTWLRDLRSRRALKRPQNPRPLEDLDERQPTALRSPDALERVLDREAERQVREAVDELPEKEGKCVILYYYQGLTTRQIGVVLRIAQGTVKAHLSHARDKLKQRLADLFDVDPEGAGMERRTGGADV